ncbi:MAG: helix-turn-helix domain-containing protein [Clostridiales bacterium]|nr:helix-turn-helix domain-containing protein [Clostridiales bacterium]
MQNEYELDAKRLVTLRNEMGKTRAVVAQDLEIDQTTYGKYELGTRQPSLSLLVKLAEYYNTSADYLLGRSDEKNIYSEEDRTFTMLRRATSGMNPEQLSKAINILKAAFDDFDWEG